MRELEQAVLAEAKIVTGNKKLKMKDIMGMEYRRSKTAARRETISPTKNGRKYSS